MIFISIHKTGSVSPNGINYSPICSLGNKENLIKSKNLPFSLRYYEAHKQHDNLSKTINSKTIYTLKNNVFIHSDRKMKL